MESTCSLGDAPKAISVLLLKAITFRHVWTRVIDLGRVRTKRIQTQAEDVASMICFVTESIPEELRRELRV